MPTMLDVAKRAGVSLSTVSYALNGTRPISQETRQRIFTAMEELGYRPHVLARGLASKRSRILALLFPIPERGLGVTELEFVSGATDAAMEQGYNLVLWSSVISDAEGLRHLMQQGLVDGVIMMEVHLHDERIELLRASELPFVLIGRTDNSQGISYVDVDFAQACSDTVRYLYELGHTQIAFLNQSQAEFNTGYGPVIRAEASFQQAVARHQIAGYIRRCAATPAAGHAALGSLLDECPDITAMVAMNERAIPGVLQAVGEQGWKVPEHFSLVSIVSSERVADMSVPPLTTMTSPSAEIGRLSVLQLIQQLDTKELEPPQMVIPCHLDVRGSSAPPPHERLAKSRTVS